MCPCSSFICASSIGMDEDRARSLSNLDIEQIVKVKRELRDAEKVYVNGILQNGLESGNNNPFWTYVKSQKQETFGLFLYSAGPF